ncbi:MAG: hypothetical protein IT256_09270 [Chitinophagaceae bacterium]|nr:hypothetical protein [Chitinophagaceae bacterium]
MKKLSLLLCVSAGIMFSSFSCNKEKDKTTTTPTPSSPYYFEFTLGGKYTKFNSPEPQYVFISPGSAGGYQTPSANELYPSIELSFTFRHPPTDADIKGLEGKKIYYYFDNSDSITAHVVYEESYTAETMYNDQSIDNNYSVKIDKVTFVKSTSSIGIPIDVYEIAGTCNSKYVDYSNGEKVSELTGGKFNMLIARRTDQ